MIMKTPTKIQILNDAESAERKAYKLFDGVSINHPVDLTIVEEVKNRIDIENIIRALNVLKQSFSRPLLKENKL